MSNDRFCGLCHVLSRHSIGQLYSKTCLMRTLEKKTKIGFQDQIIA